MKQSIRPCSTARAISTMLLKYTRSASGKCFSAVPSWADPVAMPILAVLKSAKVSNEYLSVGVSYAVHPVKMPAIIASSKEIDRILLFFTFRSPVLS
jgi:hypothetical protein